LIELREIDRENRGKTEEPSIKTETIEEKQRKQRKNGRKMAKKQMKQSKTEQE